jgi:Ca2+/Na+ antiporter
MFTEALISIVWHTVLGCFFGLIAVFGIILLCGPGQTQNKDDDLLSQFVSLVFYPVFSTITGAIIGVLRQIGMIYVLLTLTSLIVVYVVHSIYERRKQEYKQLQQHNSKIEN